MDQEEKSTYLITLYIEGIGLTQILDEATNINYTTNSVVLLTYNDVTSYYKREHVISIFKSNTKLELFN